MRRVYLVRFETGPDGTYSKVTGPAGFECWGLEKPNRGNKKDVSCVPAQEILFRGRLDSPRHPGFVYEEWDDPATPQREDVVGRENVQIHSANCEDELLGCIALGRAIMDIHRPGRPPKRGVSSSKDTVQAFVNQLDRKPFILVISWAPGAEKEVA